MYCMFFCVFLRFGDINLQRTVSKYVLGRLMWTSSRLLKEWRILFCIQVTNNYLHCVLFSVFWRYGDLDLLKAIARNVTGHLIRTSLGRFQDLGICNMTDMPTINTRDCGNASSLMIKTTLWSVYSVRIEEKKSGHHIGTS